MSDLDFLYLIGVPKAGTTWLSEAFRMHPNIALPPVKEVYYFSSVEFSNSHMATERLIQARQIAQTAYRKAQGDEARDFAEAEMLEIDRWLGLIASQRQDDATYEALLKRPRDPETQIVADCTPAYSLLSTRTFQRMATLNGGRTKFLLVLRDPMDRLWSNIDMSIGRLIKNGRNEKRARMRIMAATRNDSSSLIMRSDYQGTIQRFEAAIPEDQRLTVFYEDIFDGAALGEIQMFLNLPAPIEGHRSRINEGSGLTPTAAEREELMGILRPQYEFARTHFDSLPPRWEENMAMALA